MRPVLRVVHPKRAPALWRRYASSSSSGRGSPAAGGAGGDMRGQWSIKSPKQLYEHLSQYIIGQERAKRVLSVAVFNHYLRITPPSSSSAPPPPDPSTSQTTTSDPFDTFPPFTFVPPGSPSSTSPSPVNSCPSSRAPDATGPTPVPSPSRRHRDSARDILHAGPDPSRAGSELDDGVRRDITRAVGGDGEGADPTLTHDMLNSRSREGQWARDGFFSSTRAPTPILLSRTRRSKASSAQPEVVDGFSSSSAASRRQIRETNPAPPEDSRAARSSLSAEAGPSRQRASSARQTEIEPLCSVPGSTGAGASGGGGFRSHAEMKAKEELDEGLVGGSSGGRSAGKGKAKEEVVVEKSNVLMIGPTGTGKTLMAKTLARILDVPFASCDATTYTQAGYVGEDVENCVLRLLQNAEYDVSRTEVGIIHIDEIDKLARRGGADFGSWGGGRDVGGEGVQQALLRLLEGTTLSLTAKPPAITSSSFTPPASSAPSGSSSGAAPPTSPGSGIGKDPQPRAEAAFGNPPEWDPNNPMNRSFGAAGHGQGSGAKKGVREGLPGFGGGSGGGSGGKGETFVVDTTNILFILSGAFVGLESIVSRRLGKGSIGFGAPLPLPPVTSVTTAEVSPTPLKGLATTDLSTYGLIPEFLGRLPILSTLHPLTIEDLVRILSEPKNAMIKQYQANFEKLGSELQFTEPALRQIAKVGLDRGGGARGLRGILEEVLLDAMFDVPDSSIRYCMVTEDVVKGDVPAHYFSRGQRVTFLNMLDEENNRGKPVVSESDDNSQDEVRAEEDEVEDERMRASG